ncbi:c-type cytochrome [Bosea sp. LjRoot90]|uniref:c-type cytochrome n=1 Tax=Bosea sp. LjRoot90 TaxID=3342342 RepID=UPI003ECFCED4
MRGAGAVRLAVLGFVLACAPAEAAGDRALGEYLSSECATCHQTSGRQVGGIPAIIGHPAEQFVALMNAYRERQRENQVMQAIAARLSSEEIAALAAYYESLKPNP